MWLIITLTVLAVFLLYTYFNKSSKDFWKEHGVRQISNSSFMDKLNAFRGKISISDLDDRAYKEMRSTGESYIGIVEMQTPFLIVRDLEIIKKVMIKDFDYFMDRRGFGNEKSDPLLHRMLGNLHGDEWKGVRSSLSPTFTTGKIRRMMECFNTVGQEWVHHFNQLINESANGSAEINVPDETTHYTVDVIAAAVFGMESGSIRNPKSIFSDMVRRVSKMGAWDMMRFALVFNFPRLAGIFNIKVLDEIAVNFFLNILSQGIKERVDGTVKRNDFMQIIAEVKKGSEAKALGSDELSTFEKEGQVQTEGNKNWLADDLTANAQMIGFFFAGFSTTSNFIGFCLYALAAYPEVQEKLRDEVKTIFRNGNELDYDELNKLSYLEMFTCETLRHYPAIGRLERKCVRDYHDQESGLRVPKGALVAAPVQSIHEDLDYYERPFDFYPEHFSPENKAKRNPYTYLPFGIGPRNCIGMRFALVKSKAAIAHIVYNFRLEPTEKTPIPMISKPVGFGMQVPDNLELRLRSARK